MDSLKETDKPAPNPSKHPRIEVDEELMRQMIAGQAPLDSKVVRRIPEPEEENTDGPCCRCQFLLCFGCCNKWSCNKFPHGKPLEFVSHV